MKTLHVYLTVICLSCSVAINAADFSKEEIKKFALTSKWLGHFFYQEYRGKYESLITSSGFFISDDGKNNPEAELQETIRRLQSDDQSELEFCRFVSRFEIVLGEYPKLRKSRHQCRKFEEWKKQLSIDQVRISFASGYIKNPASSFGHLFLKLVSKSRPSELLNYGINFSARTGSETGALYSLKGLFGLYSGGFTFLPYHQMIRDYTDLEGRDIWELDLELNEAEISRLLMFIFEFDAHTINYTFLERNCAGVLEQIILIAKEKTKFGYSNFKPWIIPIESFQKVGFALVEKKFKFLPSLKTQRMRMEKRLSLSEKQEIKNELKSGNYSMLSTLSLDFLLLDKKINESISESELYNNILLVRSTRPIEKAQPTETFLSMESTILNRSASSLASFVIDEKEFGLNLTALSDRLIYRQGLSEINLLEVRMRTQSRTNWALSELGLFNFLAGETIDFLRQPISFGGGLEYRVNVGLFAQASFGLLHNTENWIYFPKFKIEGTQKNTKLFPETELYFFCESYNFGAILNPFAFKLEARKAIVRNVALSLTVNRDLEFLRNSATISLDVFF